MSENNPEQTEGNENESESTGGDTNVEADQVVVNQAPDGGGVDNNEAAPAEGESDSSE